MKLLRPLGAAFVLAGGLTLLAAPPAHAASAGGLGVRPAHADPDDPATKAYFKPLVAPGASFSDAVVVSNSSDTPMTLHVSPVDGVTSQASGAVYANRQDPVAKAGGWLTPSISSVVVAPHASVDVPFTVQVPADASAGDHLAGVAFEDANPKTSGGTFSVTEVIRAVVGVQIRVPGSAAFSMTVGTPSLDVLQGTTSPAITIPLKNKGGLLGKPSVTVDLDGNGYHRSVERALDTILPGDRIEYPFVWPDDLAPGHYRIHVRVEDGTTASAADGDSTIGSRLVGAANPGAAKQVIVRPTKQRTPMTLVLGAILGTLLAVVIGGRARRAWALRSAV